MKAKEQLKANIRLLDERGFQPLASSLEKQYFKIVSERRESKLEVIKLKEKRSRLKVQSEILKKKNAEDRNSPHFCKYFSINLELETSELRLLTLKTAAIQAKIKLIKLNYIVLKIHTE